VLSSCGPARRRLLTGLFVLLPSEAAYRSLPPIHLSFLPCGCGVDGFARVFTSDCYAVGIDA